MYFLSYSLLFYIFYLYNKNKLTNIAFNETLTKFNKFNKIAFSRNPTYFDLLRTGFVV